jgi:hypothetical protein
MTAEEIEACWRDPRNYKWGFYCCKADPRPIVPKRIKWMGWTINVARPSAVPALLLLLALTATPIFIARSNGAGDRSLVITGLVSITVLCLLCASISSPRRWSH